MRLRRRAERQVELDVSAFADVAFLLIIFFILTTTFIKPAGSKLEIPSGASDPSRQEEKHLTISISGDEIRYGENAEEMSVDELRGALLLENFKAKEPSRRIVIVNSAPEVPYELYFRVVMAINNADGVLALVEEEAGP